MKLSVCMIMKNEEKWIEQCLKSIHGIADEIVIVDTGSTDKSIEIAKHYSAIIKKDKWRFDFSYHRNQSIDMATGDWLLFIDADERLLGNVQELKMWLKTVPSDCSALTVKMEDIQAGQVAMRFNPPKIFRTGKVKFENIVHNKAMIDGKIGHCDIVFYQHYGYDLDAKQRQAKVDRTTVLLKKRLKKNQKDYEAHFYLSQQYGWSGNVETAIKHANEYLKNKDNIGKEFNKSVYFSAARMCMTLERFEEAKMWIESGLKEIPNDLDLALALCELGNLTNNIGLMAIGAQNYCKIYKQFENISKTKGAHFTHSYKPEAFAFCSFNLGVAQVKQGMLTLAAMNEALSKSPPAFKAEIMKNIDVNLNQSGLQRIET